MNGSHRINLDPFNLSCCGTNSLIEVGNITLIEYNDGEISLIKAKAARCCLCKRHWFKDLIGGSWFRYTTDYLPNK